MNTSLKQLKKRENTLMYVFLMPAVIFVLVMTIYPLFRTFQHSMEYYRLTEQANRSFSGLGNYIEMFTNERTIKALGTSLKFTVCSVFLEMVIGIIMALTVNAISKGRAFYRILLSIPMLLSTVVVGIMWKFLLNTQGPINYLLQMVGLSEINWFETTSMAFLAIVIVGSWQWTSYVFMLVLAGLEPLPEERLSAAMIDGANALQIFRYITWPFIIPVVKVVALFRVIFSFRGFDLVYALTGGGPAFATETLSLSIWRSTFQNFDVGLGSAQSVAMFVILLCLSIPLVHSMVREI